MGWGASRAKATRYWVRWGESIWRQITRDCDGPARVAGVTVGGGEGADMGAGYKYDMVPWGAVSMKEGHELLVVVLCFILVTGTIAWQR